MSRRAVDTIVVVMIGKTSFNIKSTAATPTEVKALPRKKLNDAELLQTLTNYGYEVLSMAGPFSGMSNNRYLLQKFA